MKRVEPSLDDELHALETGALDPVNFPHPEHVRLGYEMLGRYSFGEAVTRFSNGLKLLAAKSGQPDVYHETITIAFLALIGEPQEVNGDWFTFKARNPELLDKRCLERWYGAEQLSSELARKTFCLPKPRRARSRINSSGRRRWPSESQALGCYAAIFSAYVVWSSAMTLRSHGDQPAILLLASIEVIAGVLFAFRRTRLAALTLLLCIFAVATVADFAHGGLPIRFLFYAASALFIVRLGKPRAEELSAGPLASH